ncbi:MAG: helicase-exonuclease AddAB subunit AddA, partial [Anaerotignaceae bacterium]
KIKENPENEHLKRQMTLLDRAQITTIDSFCLRVVKENYMYINIDPAFRTADEKECDLIKSQILEDLFEEKYAEENNEDFLGLVESFSEDTGDVNLKSLILKVYNFVQSNPFPEQWLLMASENFNINPNTSIEDTSWGAFIKRDTLFILHQLKVKTENAIDIAMGFEGPANYEPALSSDLSSINFLIRCLEQDMAKFSSVLMEMEFEKLGRKGKGDSEILVQMVKDLREQVKKGIADIQNRYFFGTSKNMVEDVARLYPTAKALTEIVKRFGEEFKKTKRDKLLVDYNDMEHYALNILLEEGSTIEKPVPSAVALNMQKHFFEVLTDEYQDSNLVQEMLLCAISGHGKDQKNRFMVGDVKQSIYRFRQAEPGIFMEKYDTYKDSGDEVRIDLYKNFRSRENILEGINFLFCQLMSPNLGDLVYDDKTALYPGAEFPVFKEEEEQKAVEIDIINLKADDENFESDEEEDMAAAEVEMTFVAKRITELVDSGFKVLGEDGKYRKICYRDIVILFRATKNWSNAASEALEKAGIPVFAQTESKYFANTEISVILSILKIVDNSRQDIPLMAALKSPIYKITDDELVRIKIFGGKCEFYDNVVCYAEKEDETAKKLIKFINDIDRWKKACAFTPVNRLLWTIYSETGYFDYIGVKVSGKIRQANLRLLAEKAEMLEKSNFKGLFNFIRYIEKLEQTSSDTSEATILGENEDLVRIMTIHKSKGLEFPVVFVCGTGKQFNQNDLNKSVLMHQRLGMGMEYIDYENRVKYNTISRTVMRENIKRENLSEEMRVLYVALTRAKEKLILTGGVRDMDKMAVKWGANFRNKETLLSVYDLQKSLTYIDWIGAAIVRHRDGEILLDKAGITSMDNGSGLFNHKSVWNVNIINRNEVVNWINHNCEKVKNEDEDESREKIEIDSNKLEQYLTFNYQYENLTKLPANVSVSEIKRNHLPPIEGVIESYPPKTDYRRPKQFIDKKALDGSQKGTAIHNFMEHMDLRKAYTLEEIFQEIEALKNKNLLTKEEAEVINKEKILKFVTSEIGQRLRKADEVYKEESFAMELTPYEIYGKAEYRDVSEGILIHGIIDCFFTEGENVILYDYKTDYVSDGMGQELLEKYKIQMEIYKRAIERITGKRVSETFIYSFYLDKVIVVGN